MLAGFPVEIAPTAQGLWMRGASLTMLHQPTPRTDLVVWAEDTMNVIGMIEAKAVIVSEPFLVAIPVLEEKGIKVLTVTDLLAAEPIDPVDVGEDDLALMQLTSGSTGSPKAVQITHRNIYSNAEAMFIGAEYDVTKDVMVSWLPCFHDMGMVGFLTIPMYFGAELVKVTPMDFLRDTLLWAKLIDKYKGTMTAAPNFAYALFAKRLRTPGQAGRVRPVDAAVRAVRRRARRARRRRGPARRGQAVRSAARRDPARLRHGRDHAGGVVLPVRRRPGGRRGRRRPAGRAAPRRARHQGQHAATGLAGPAADGPRGPRHRRARQHHAAARCRRHRTAR